MQVVQVVSGKKVEEPVPWMAIVQIKGTESKDDHWCGGALVSEKHVLSHATCICSQYLDCKKV